VVPAVWGVGQVKRGRRLGSSRERQDSGQGWLDEARAGETLKKAASEMKRKAHGAQRPRKRAKRVSAKANLQVMPELHNNELGERAKTQFRRRLTSAQPM